MTLLFSVTKFILRLKQRFLITSHHPEQVSVPLIKTSVADGAQTDKINTHKINLVFNFGLFYKAGNFLTVRFLQSTKDKIWKGLLTLFIYLVDFQDII